MNALFFHNVFPTKRFNNGAHACASMGFLEPWKSGSLEPRSKSIVDFRALAPGTRRPKGCSCFPLACAAMNGRSSTARRRIRVQFWPLDQTCTNRVQADVVHMVSVIFLVSYPMVREALLPPEAFPGVVDPGLAEPV